MQEYVCGESGVGAVVRGGYLELIADRAPGGGYYGGRVDSRGLGLRPGMAGPDGTTYNTVALEFRSRLPVMGGRGGGWGARAGGRAGT